MKARISLYNALEVIAVAENKLADLSTDFANDISTLTLTVLGWNFYVQNVYFFEMALIQPCN